MGLYDDPANISLVRDTTGQKPFYIGHSQGTTQILYGLAKEKQNGGTFFAENLAKAILLSAVTSPNMGTYEENESGLFQYQGLGVYNVNEPNWDANLSTLCSNLSVANCLSATLFA